MANGRHFENDYISISQPQIVQIARNLVCRHKFYRKRRKRQKSEIRIFKMSDGRGIKNHFSAITQLHVVPLWWNLEWRGRSHAYEAGQVIKYLITKIQNSGLQYFENGYTSVSQTRIIQNWRNIVHKHKFWHSWGNVTNINLKSI